MNRSKETAPSAAAILEKNRIYDHAAAAVWRLAVYDPVYSGWEFSNMGGFPILDFIGEYGGLNSTTRVVEFCSGLGDTSIYLVKKFGCHVTGIEINARQVAHAKRKASCLDPTLAERLTFVRHDVLTWQPEHSYDAVYALDSLMLVSDIPRALKKAREVLKPEGLLVFAEIVAGPEITDDVRQHVWDVDGIINLPTMTEYTAMLGNAGFVEIQLEVVTRLAQDCFDKIALAVRERKQDITEASGTDAYRSWLHVADYYQQCFREKRLGYIKFAATRRQH